MSGKKEKEGFLGLNYIYFWFLPLIFPNRHPAVGICSQTAFLMHVQGEIQGLQMLKTIQGSKEQLLRASSQCLPSCY